MTSQNECIVRIPSEFSDVICRSMLPDIGDGCELAVDGDKIVFTLKTNDIKSLRKTIESFLKQYELCLETLKGFGREGESG